MKKSMVLAVSVAAMSISGGAMALNAAAYSTLPAPGAPINTNLGLVGRVSTIVAMGAAPLPAQACRYGLVWDSPFSPNESQWCVIAEAKVAPFNLACATNRSATFPTSVQAGPGVPAALGGATFCAGFDQVGQGYPADGIQLMLTVPPGAPAIGGLSGLMIVPLQMPLFVNL